MTLFITSSPFDEAAEMPLFSNANGFVDRLRAALPEYPSVTFVASSPERHDLTCRFGADAFTALANAGICPSQWTVLDGMNAEDAPEIVSSSDLLIFAGGHVPTQAAFFRDIALDVLLQDYPGVIIGISAGSMNMARSVYAQPEEPGEAVDPGYARFFPGLDLTEVNVLPHYQKVKDDLVDGLRLFEDITLPDSRGRCFFAIPDGSYFYQDDSCLMLCGKSCLVRDGVLSPLTQDGEILNMEHFE